MEIKSICVLGLGYIGLPTASTFATHGIRVIGVDVNPQVLETLRNGEIHIHEPGLRTLVQAGLRSGNLIICAEPAPADAFIIAVPTPFKDDKRADLRFVISAAESIVPHLQPGNLVVLESTSPPRTTIDVVAPILERSGLRLGSGDGLGDFFLAYSPERVLPGQILRELIENARVIVGFVDGLKASGLGLDETLVEQGDNSFSGEAAGRRLLELKDPPTAIFAANDDMAAGVIRATALLGVAVPGRLSVAGCDDIALASQLCPTLTTIRQPLETMAEHAALALIRGSNKSLPPRGADVIPATMCIRESTGPAPKR